MDPQGGKGIPFFNPSLTLITVNTYNTKYDP